MKAILIIEDDSSSNGFQFKSILEISEFEMLQLTKTGGIPESKAKNIADALIAVVKASMNEAGNLKCLH